MGSSLRLKTHARLRTVKSRCCTYLCVLLDTLAEMWLVYNLSGYSVGGTVDARLKPSSDTVWTKTPAQEWLVAAAGILKTPTHIVTKGVNVISNSGKLIKLNIRTVCYLAQRKRALFSNLYRKEQTNKYESRKLQTMKGTQLKSL